MKNEYVIPSNDPDLNAFERLIADFHPQLYMLKDGENPSYENPKFYLDAPIANWLPGNDGDYCQFAFSLFNDAHVHNYLLECHLFLEKAYGRKKDGGIQKMKASFDELTLDEDSDLMKQICALIEESCAIWNDTIYEYVTNPHAYIYEDLHRGMIHKCDAICVKLKEIAKSEELNVGDLKTLNYHGKYGLLAKILLQGYEQLLPSRKTVFTLFCKQKLGQAAVEGEYKIPRAVDLILAHQLALTTDDLEEGQARRKEMLPSPSDFIYVEINKKNKAQAKELKSTYRWLFLKAWLYSFLKDYSATLSDAARQMAIEDPLFYRDDMDQLEDCCHEVEREELIEKRFKNIKNELSEWNKNKPEEGYIYSQLLAKSKPQS